MKKSLVAALPFAPLVAPLFAMLACLAAFSYSAPHARAAESADPDADYDRMDGTGASGKKVNVIEWEGNLEIHVYPGGSLKGLALKLDKRNKDKPVMVIGYRFDSDPQKTLIRRAILGIDLQEGFKAFRDPSSGSEYDKVVISNNGLASPLTSFKLDPAPTQLYPDGHPALAQGPDGGKNGYKSPADQRKPAAVAPSADAGGTDDRPADPGVDDSGTIQPFFMKGSAAGRR